MMHAFTWRRTPVLLVILLLFSAVLCRTETLPTVVPGTDGTPLISNVFADSDLRQVLMDIGTQAGVTIIPDNTVQGTVTAELKNVPLERALAMVLRVGNYAYAKLDGYYLVGVADPSNPNFYLFSRTEIIQLKHTSPETVQALLGCFYGKYMTTESRPQQSSTTVISSQQELPYMRTPLQGASASRGPLGQYRIIITAPEPLLERIKADIARIDQPPTQVMLEAAVIELSSQALTDISLNWASKWLNQDMTSGGPNLVYSKIAHDEMVELTALVQHGKARLRANPRIATLEGQTAEIEVGKENYFQIVTGPVTYPYATLEKITSGILLQITPHVLEGEGEVLAEIEPEVRDVSGKSTNGLPEITYRRAMTTLRVKDGQSIVIGGLTNIGKDRTVSKIPLLGDIPLLGNLFRSVSRRETTDEVVIVITPHIINDWAETETGISPEMKKEMAPGK